MIYPKTIKTEVTTRNLKADVDLFKRGYMSRTHDPKRVAVVRRFACFPHGHCPYQVDELEDGSLVFVGSLRSSTKWGAPVDVDKTFSGMLSGRPIRYRKNLASKTKARTIAVRKVQS